MAWWRATDATTASHTATGSPHADPVPPTSSAHAPRGRASISEAPRAADVTLTDDLVTSPPPGVVAPSSGEVPTNGGAPTVAVNGAGRADASIDAPPPDASAVGERTPPGRWWCPYPDDDAPRPDRGAPGTPRHAPGREVIAALAHRAPRALRRAAEAGRRRVVVAGVRARRVDAAALRASLGHGADAVRREGARVARQDARLAGAAARAAPHAADRVVRATARGTVQGGRSALVGLWAFTQTRAREAGQWLRVEAPRRARRVARQLRAVAPSFAVTLVVGGTALGLLLALLIPTAVLARHVASYQPTSTRLHPVSVRSTVYAVNGATLANLGFEDREPIAYQDVSPLIVDAVVATEDRTFWTNPGVDASGLIRAATTDIAHGAVQQGGSTITEQLVKNRIMNPKGSLQKKVTEAVLALRLNRRLSKRQIMTDYLNTVYFGEGAYGIQAAAERYFLSEPPGSVFPVPTEPNQVNLAQAALLAGLIANPTTFDPFLHPALAKARRHEVLSRMVTVGDISPGAARYADASPLPDIPPSSPDLRPRDLWVSQVQTELLGDPRLGATYADRLQLLLRGGLRVYTSLDQTAQLLAQQAVNEILPNQPPFTAALLAMDPTTGAVRAMVGGPGFDQLQYNIATHPPGRQTGSTFKVITLAAALEAGYSPNDTVNGTSPCLAVRPGFPPWSTVNAEAGQGTMSLRQATVNSVNCAFAHVIASLGPPAVVAMAHRLGVTGNIPDYLPITLGVASTTPLEMATVISTIADQGVRHDPTFVSRVVGPDGHVYIDNTQPPGQRVLDPSIADCETDMLHGVITGGTGTAAQLPGRDAAGKTGTTDSFGDAWFDGFTPQLATTVWMGATTGEVPMTDVGGIQVFGGTYPARIWQAFMSAELAGQPAPPLPPAGPVCGRPGAPITDAGRGVPSAGAGATSPTGP